MKRLGFTLLATDPHSRARRGRFQTLHGVVETPVFMPVGTQATVRGQRNETLEALAFPVLLANTYHLMLRPGPEVFKRAGGIQKFMDWKGSVLTDSGGFQIFSLPNERRMFEEGALFKSYVNKEDILLTPERSIEMQRAIGSDIMMVLDQCIPSHSDYKEAEVAMHLTHRWAKRSFKARGDSAQSLFGIVQGACYPELRKISASVLTEIDFDGFAIGGLAVGETKQEREDMTELAASLLPSDLPRYLMGVGTPVDLLEAVHRGVDMFDCILPTALGQQGVAYTSVGKLDARRGAYKYSDEPLDPNCACNTCQRYSLAYLHHLVRVKEHTGGHLIAAHNLTFYANMMREIRDAITEQRFYQYYLSKRQIYGETLRHFPITVPKTKSHKRPLELGAYALHETREGVFTIRHKPSLETMHAVNDPMEESRTLYINQSRFEERLQEASEKPLVVWDVGLGAGFNAMAAIQAYESLEKAAPIRDLELVSFENDLDSLRLSLKHPGKLPHLRHAGPVSLLQSGNWTSKKKNIRWTLLEGDFRERMAEAPVPDLIFFDPFSLNTDSNVWTLEVFQKIHRHCRSHYAELFTYSSSTGVRALLLAAGFFVGKGVRMGTRPETTVALTTRNHSQPNFHNLLLGEWVEHWNRSGAKFPASISPTQYGEFEERIRGHAQFFVQ